jgi:hypothetical protein
VTFLRRRSLFKEEARELMMSQRRKRKKRRSQVDHPLVNLDLRFNREHLHCVRRKRIRRLCQRISLGISIPLILTMRRQSNSLKT